LNEGYDRYLAMNFKLQHQNCPVLSDYKIRPFIFANACYAPNIDAIRSNQDDKQVRYVDRKIQNSVKSTLNKGLANSIRSSFGLGASIALPFGAIECYCNLKLNNQPLDQSSRISINLGID
jgi:outer membrane protein assembly factor BamA